MPYDRLIQQKRIKLWIERAYFDFHFFPLKVNFRVSGSGSLYYRRLNR